MERKLTGLLLIIFLTVCAGCAKRPVQPGETRKTGIEGRVAHYDQYLESAYVYVYRDLDFDKTPLYVSAPSRDDGKYGFEIPPGRYYILARKEEPDPDTGVKYFYFSYFGGNPIIIREGEYSWVGLNCVKAEDGDIKVSDNADRDEAVLTGRVTYKGWPLENAYVYIYADDKTDFKGPGFRTSLPTDKEGGFKFVNLPEGKYYLNARKRNSPGFSGPVQVGDHYGYFQFNPVDVRRGRKIEVNIRCIVRAPGETGKKILSIGSGDIIIRGRIIDMNGKPAQGIYAFLYKTPVMGHERPVYISNVTDESGEYEIRLKEGGKYYIGARQVFGNAPRPGELYGLYDENPEHSVTVKAGEVKERLDINVRPVLE